MKKLILIATLVTGCDYNLAKKDVHNLQSENQAQAEAITNLQSQSVQLQLIVNLLLERSITSEAAVDAVQETVNLLAANIAQLQGYKHVKEIIDPCGDAPGKLDEILLRLDSGEILVSFSDSFSGLNTRFAIVAPGTYGTSDGTLCTFTVNTSGIVVW